MRAAAGGTDARGDGGVAEGRKPRMSAGHFVSAHRGASGTHCENTVDAMAEAVRLGAEQVRSHTTNSLTTHLVLQRNDPA